jgi:hypothetical protein
MAEILSQGQLVEICHSVLKKSQDRLKRFKEEKWKEPQIECYLLEKLLKSVRLELGLDPNTTLTIKIKRLTDVAEEENPQELKNSIKSLLEGKTSYDYQAVIQKELLDRANQSFFGSIVKLIKP